jgi:AAA+ superfamily predicted ATPase
MQWFNRFSEIYSAGIAHSFILHFNVKDYAAPDQPCTPAQYLTKRLASRDIVANYSRDQGITFPTATMEKNALEILDLDQQPANDPALAALAALGTPTPQPGELPRSPGQALPLLDKILRNSSSAAVIIEDGSLITPDASLAILPPEDRDNLAMLARWGRDPKLISNGNPIFVLTDNLSAIHNELRTASNRWEAIEIPLPGPEGRQAFVNQWMEKNAKFLADEDVREPQSNETESAKIAALTAGLSLVQVEDILLRGNLAGELTARMIQERKETIIRNEYGDVLEIIEPKFSLADIGGLAHVKDFFTKNVIRPIKDGRRGRVPMGVLMTGPAGTGKSIMAVAVAKEAGINAVNLRIGGQIASKWQGEGERNLDKALRAIQGLAPTIVFIDEIDQVISRGDGGNQQNSRIFQRLLEFMSDTGHRGQVVFLAATNRPDLMDAALHRPGRFDKKIPFLVPDLEERDDIFRVMTRRYLDIEPPVSDETLTLTEGWTGAEIEAAVIKAAEIIEDEDQAPSCAIDSACERLSPSTADIELMTALAIRECNDRDLLPPRYREMLNDRQKLDDQISEKKGNISRGSRTL